MFRTRIILVVVAALLVWLIFLLPKSVVENESQLKEAAPEEAVQGAGHTEVPATLSATIKSVRALFQSDSPNQKNAIFADSLRTLYTQAGQFDSAAWFAGQAATFFNTTESFWMPATAITKLIPSQWNRPNRNNWQSKPARG